MARHNVHATGLVLGTTGLVLRGPSGAGKSLLALALLDAWEGRGQAALLVADDRTDLEASPGGVLMHAPPSIAGLIELRGRGIVTRAHVATAELHLVVDLVPSLERMPEDSAFTTEVLGAVLPRCPVPQHGVVGLGHQLMLVREALRRISPDRVPPRQNST